MKIKIVGKSDYLALMLGRPELLRIRSSEPLEPRLAMLDRAKTGEPLRVLMLGATGFVGMHIIRELLARKDVAKVYTLVRNKRASTGQSRLAAAMRGYGLTLATGDRLRVLSGDFTADRFGLSEADFAEIRGTVDVVLNAAGATNHTYPYAYYRSETIVPLLRMMEFCLTDRVKSLHFIGSMNGDVFRSTRDFFRVGFYHCGYSRMKWIVKYLAIWAHEHGISASVYMPPHVVGSTLTGFKDPGLRYSFWHMIWYGSRLGMLWEADDPVPVIPADALSREVCDNALSASPKGFVYPATYISNAELAKTFGWTLVSWKAFRAALKREFSVSFRKWNPRKPLASLYDMFLHTFFTRALFTRDLPDLISAVTRAAQRHGPPVATESPPSHFIEACARRNYVIGRSVAGPPASSQGPVVLNEITNERL